MMREERTSARCLLGIRDVSMVFGDQVALDRVGISIAAGEVHGLAGHNGSGKSTLIKILAGYHQPEAGALLELEGKLHPWQHAPRGWQQRLRFVHQDLALALNLSALENFALGGRYARRAGLRIDWPKQARATAESLARLHIDLDVRVPVSRLSPVDRTMVAIARAFDRLPEDGVLVLDEPTAALTRHESTSLFELVRRITTRGAGVLFVTHHLDELLDIADAVTVLRNGRVSESAPRSTLTGPMLAEAIAGAPALAACTGVLGRGRVGATVRMQVRGLSDARLAPLTFDAHVGEIVGIAGLTGSGRDTVAGLIGGQTKPATGAVEVDGNRVPLGNARTVLRSGVALVPADRQAQALFRRHSVADNVTIPGVKDFSRFLRIDRGAERRAARESLQRANVVPALPDRQITEFSGGNQQKAVLARCLRARPKVLVLDEPTQGVDIGARAAIRKLLRAAAEQGSAVVVCSSDNEELAELCDRVLVMARGRVYRVVSGGELSETALARACLGNGCDESAAS
jgi:ribose transport system ATP-binding protein